VPPGFVDRSNERRQFRPESLPVRRIMLFHARRLNSKKHLPKEYFPFSRQDLLDVVNFVYSQGKEANDFVPGNMASCTLLRTWVFFCYFQAR
jgi:hypothetical protein